MEVDNKKFAVLEQEIKQIRERLTPILTKNSCEASHRSHFVTNVIGVVKLVAAPHFGLVLDTGTPELPFDVPVVMVDSAKHVKQWISILGKKVWINRLMIVFDRCRDVECVNALILWEDVKILESSCIEQQISCPRDEQLLTDHMKADCDSRSNFRYRIMVHHVCSPFHIDQLATFCLLLISYTNKKLVETKLWLVLKEEQVAWKEFLIPNREYLIIFSQISNQFWFDETRKPLKELFPSSFHELDVLYHHKKLFPTLDGAILPSGSKLFLTCNTQFSKYIYQFVNDSSSLWFSSNEADYADTGLVTFYGRVDAIKYDTEAVFKTCYLCTWSRGKQPPILKPSFTTSHWLNPWITNLTLDKDEWLALPTAESGCGVMETGVPGKLVQILKLRDVITGEEQSVYVKHSYISHSQQMCRLSPGMIVCLTYLNRRCSSKGKYYYTTTVLSSIKVLSLPSDFGQNQCWGVYGLNCSSTPCPDRMWGVLETVNLTKVNISARCVTCSTLFYNGTCSEECSRPSAQTSALAIGWIQVIQDENTISMEKVLIKDDLVRELLCIPANIWQLFVKAAVEEELICFFSNQSIHGPPKSSDFCELFKMYCMIPKPNGKFYISVKKLFSCSDNEPFYYCIDLKPIEENRLKIIAELAKKALLK